MAPKFVFIIGHMRANPSLPVAPAGKCKQKSDPVPPLPPSINTQRHAFKPRENRRLLTEIL
jgi:hypothetical protein